MHLKPIALLAISVCLAACGVQSATGAEPTPAQPALDIARLKELTRTLSSDAFEGRAPMTPAEARTIDFIAAEFKAAGLQSGNGGGWFQDVPLVEMTVDPATANAVFSKTGAPILTATYGADIVLWSKRVETKLALDDSEMVFVGYGVNAPEKGWNDYAGVDMRGKTAVILINDPDWQTKTLEGPFGGRAMTYYGRWTYKFEEAARQGAAAAIIIHDTEPAAYGWATVKSSWTGPQLDMDRGDGGKNRVVVEGWVQKPVAERLITASGHSLQDLADAAKVKGFKAVQLGIAMTSELTSTINKAMSHNVVGILPGSERPDEYVLYTAHWDHLGRCEADASGDDICNGALDNATGTAGLITLAKAHAAAGPAKRSLVFLAVTAEESGLLGSEYYADHPVFPLAKTISGINMDGLNVIGPTHDIIVIGAGKSELEAYLKTEAAAQQRVIVAETTPEKGSYYRSDHFSLAKRGVPMLNAGSGVDIIGKGKSFGQAARDDYTANRYHQPGDGYDPNWNWEGAVADLTLNYRIGRRIADSAAWPNWNAGDEFRAVRDASRAATK